MPMAYPPNHKHWRPLYNTRLEGLTRLTSPRFTTIGARKHQYNGGVQTLPNSKTEPSSNVLTALI
jgi:hypothetical protein